MKYSLCPGLVLTRVCDTDLLVATRQARGKCPNVNRLNRGGAYYFRLLQGAGDTEQVLLLAARDFHTDPERLRPGLEAMVQQFARLGYLTLEDQT